ncbi:MAG: hypothetical protein ABSD10_02725 [Candidatus Saccharimonadales bacterium]|jgi:hypothetical protein
MFESPKDASFQVKLALAEAQQVWGEADQSLRTELIETGGTSRTDKFVTSLESYLGEKYGLGSDELMFLVESAAWSPETTDRLIETARQVKEELND